MAKGSILRRLTAAVIAAAVFLCAPASVFAAKSDDDTADKLYSRDGDTYIYITQDKYLYNFKGDNPGLTICGYVGDSGKLTIPYMINGRDVTAIQADTFVNDERITSVTMPGTLKEIGKNCFNGCPNLKEVKLRGNVNEFREVFCGCTALEKMIFPQGVGSIIASFKDCTALTYVRFSRSVSTIDEESFKGCTALTDIEWLGNMNSLNDSFDGCTGLEEVILPGGLIRIDGAFDGCTALRSISFPDTLLYITSGFSGCTALTELTLPEKLLFVNDAFDGCKELSKVRSSQMTTISASSFTGCPKLTIEKEKEGSLWLVLGHLAVVIVAVITALLVYRYLDEKAKQIGRATAQGNEIQ